MRADMILVNYPQQIFNDSLNSIEQVKKIDRNKEPFAYWQYCTWSIVTSAIAMESYITDHIESIKNEMGVSLWGLYERESRRLANSRGLYSKIKIIELITDNVIINLNDSDWNNISKSITLRNDLVHYNKTGIFNLINETNCENAIKSCRDLIKKFHAAIGTSYPTWVDKQQSESYD